jgi:carbon storage regulator
MLVLGRYVGEKIQIGSNVIIEVIEIRGDRVRLGITAPGDVPVHRTEVGEKIVEQGRVIPEVGPKSKPIEEMAG